MVELRIGGWRVGEEPAIGNGWFCCPSVAHHRSLVVARAVGGCSEKTCRQEWRHGTSGDVRQAGARRPFQWLPGDGCDPGGMKAR